MKIEKYIVESARTLNSGIHYLKDSEIDSLHGAIGVATELEEFAAAKDIVNMSEELADMMWYVSILARRYELKLDYPSSLTPSYSMDVALDVKVTSFVYNMTLLSSKLLDIYKKHMFYGREIIDSLVIQNVLDMHSHIYAMCTYGLKLDFEAVLENNINKLKVRFPQCFDANLALNRNLEAERKELENKIC